MALAIASTYEDHKLVFLFGCYAGRLHLVQHVIGLTRYKYVTSSLK